MRALALVILVPAVAYADSSQYEQIRVDAGITGSTVAVSDRNGTGMVVEIKAIARDNLAIGGRVEIAMMFGGRVGNDELPLDFAMAACGLVKAEMYFAEGPVRPFVGLGAGAYTIGSQTVDDGPNTRGFRTETGNYLGVAPQVGIDLGRLRFAVTYNAILGAGLELRQMVGGVEQTSTVSQNYLSLEASFQFAGGKKKPPPPPQPTWQPQPQWQPPPQPMPPQPMPPQ